MSRLSLTTALFWTSFLWVIVTVSSRPNVLFLVVDDLRPKLGCYGESDMVTPNIDQLASKSVRFDRAYVQQAVCSPSRTSFLTGRRPDTTHIFDLQTYFRNLTGNFTTLPQHFKNNGYLTQSVGKIFHPGDASGGTDDYPYSWTYPAYHAPTQRYRPLPICPGPDGKLHNNACCPVDLNQVPGRSLPDIQNTDFAIEFLRNRSLDLQPFFLAVGYHKPHLPFRYPKEYLNLYPLSKVHLAPNTYLPEGMPDVAFSPWPELRSYDDIQSLNVSFPFGPVPAQYQLLLRQSYSAAASYTDAQIGRLLDALDTFGFGNNTVITFHGDHGWQLGEHDEWCKHTNFEITTRTPMLIYIPGVTSKKTSPGNTFPFTDALQERPTSNRHFAAPLNANLSTDALVEAVDLFATLSELAGLEVPPICPPVSSRVLLCTEGSSLVPVIQNVTGSLNDGPLKWKSAVFSQYSRPSDHIQHNSDLPDLADIRIMGYTMRTDQHRYTEWVAYDPKTFTADWSHVYARELYVHTTDPDENYNVVDIEMYKALVIQLSRQLRDGWRNAWPL